MVLTIKVSDWNPELKKFWMIMRTTGICIGPSSKKHYSYDKAVKEAERLANLHPGDEFIILESTSIVTLPKPQPVQLVWR